MPSSNTKMLDARPARPDRAVSKVVPGVDADIDDFDFDKIWDDVSKEIAAVEKDDEDGEQSESKTKVED